MSDDNQSQTDTPEVDPQQQQEYDSLKARAELLGLAPRKNWTLATLKKKVEDALSDSPKEEDAPEAKASKQANRLEARKEANLLVRCIVSSRNPNKNAWQGEIISVSGSAFGTIKKYIQFDVPFHVPVVILDYLKDRKYQKFTQRKDEKGRMVTTSALAPEFNIQELAPISEQELKQIANRQAAQITSGEQ